MSEHAEPDFKNYSPQLVRLLQLAEMEAKRLSGRGVTVMPEHLLIAAMQDAEPSSGIYELLTKSNLTIGLLRQNVFEPQRHPLPTIPA